MKYKKTLVTGSTGELGRAIISSGHFNSLLTPTRRDMEITNAGAIEDFFNENEFDSIIHCAALARMKKCEENPDEAIANNIIGTANLVMSTLRKEKKEKRKIRFVHISTDGVYPGVNGNYSEKDGARPYNMYGWTKLGAECPANALQNHCIIRTSFFDTKNIKFRDAAADAYSSKVPIAYLAKAISILLNNNFVGIINVGRKKRSDYEHYKEFKPGIKKCRISDIQKAAPFAFYKDCSMDTSLWKKIEKEND